VHHQHAPAALLLLAGICGQAACAGRSATTPDGLSRTYGGAWVGTTSEGTTIAFAVSDRNIVTQITVGRDNRGCRDPQMFSGLSLLIGASDLAGRVPIASSPGFGFGSGSPEGRNFVQVLGQFSSTQSAQGTVAFLNVARSRGGRNRPHHDSKYEPVRVDMRPAKRESRLCQNWVTYPLKPPVNTVIYEDTPTHIDVE